MEYVVGEVDKERVLPFLLYKGWANASLTTERYRSKGTPSLSQLKTSSVAMLYLKAKKACSQFSSHRNGLVFLSNL